MWKPDAAEDRKLLRIQTITRLIVKASFLLLVVGVAGGLLGALVLAFIGRDKAAGTSLLAGLAVGLLGVALARIGVKLGRHYNSAVAQRIDLRGLLAEQLSDVQYNPDAHLSTDAVNSALSVRQPPGLRVQLGGHLVHARWRNRELTTSHAGIAAGRADVYNGQVCMIKAKGNFPGRLLLMRPARMAKGGAARLLGELSLADRPIAPEGLPAGWVCFSDTPEAALQALGADGALFRLLSKVVGLDFVLYRGDAIASGGQYQLSLSRGDPETLRAYCRNRISALVKEGLATVDAFPCTPNRGDGGSED